MIMDKNANEFITSFVYFVFILSLSTFPKIPYWTIWWGIYSLYFGCASLMNRRLNIVMFWCIKYVNDNEKSDGQVWNSYSEHMFYVNTETTNRITLESKISESIWCIFLAIITQLVSDYVVALNVNVWFFN